MQSPRIEYQAIPMIASVEHAQELGRLQLLRPPHLFKLTLFLFTIQKSSMKPSGINSHLKLS
jgi:hypothetical protein